MPAQQRRSCSSLAPSRSGLAGRAGGGEQAGVELALGRQPGRVQSPQNGAVTEAMTPISPPPSA
jgi:hypothetical protein